MITYHKGTLQIATTTGTHTINATIASNGLAYHPTHHSEPDALDLSDWTVSHVASGYMLCSLTDRFRCSDDCRTFIESVGELTDWSAQEPALTDEIKLQVELKALALA